jgi:capsule polysaccharide modification protein KpsS
MLNTILNNPSEIEQLVFKELEKEAKCKIKIITYWSEKELKNIKKNFPYITTINLSNLIKKGVNGDFKNLDQDYFSIKEKIYEYEHITFHMMDRLDSAKIISYNERFNLYKFLICFWKEILEKNNINFFYSRITPHEVADFVLLNIVKIFKKKVFIFGRAFNDIYYFPTNDYIGPWKTLEDQIKINNKKNIKKIKNPIIEKQVNQILSNYNSGKIPTLVHMEKFKDNFIQLKINKLLRILQIFFNVSLFNIKSDYYILKVFRKSFSSLLIKKNFQNLKKQYKKYFIYKKNLPRNYIYFLLPFQPENTTIPEGGKFYDVFLVLSLISKNIPKNWKILVKEHPAQYIKTRGMYGYIGRDINYYDRLKCIKKVILFNDNKYKHFYTLDRAKAIATVNGTAGWEALIRQKPSIVFGEAFYSTAPNVIKINKLDDLSSLVKKIDKMKKFDKKKLLILLIVLLIVGN